MLSRRDWFGAVAGAGATLALSPRLVRALEASARLLPQGQLIKRAIPSSGELLPVIGLGSSATFSQVARQEDKTALKEVLRTMIERGATVFDTAPSYGASEAVAGEIAAELGLTNKVFWATKVNVAGRGNGAADPAAARAQLDASFGKVKRTPIDLIQVHNLGDVPTQLAILKELKAAKKIRYTGVTTTSDGQYAQLATIMRNEPIDFIGIDYAVDNRGVEEVILPLAQERKIGVLVYAPFGRTSLFRRTANTPLPEWAKDFDATTWAQFFLKFIISHPAVTAVTPATSQAKNMIDNIGGGIGRLPDAATRQKMAVLVDALPPATR
ncbi:MAG: aldo/keto reductase [Gemmatimonadaceae bacterium]|jgi:aryl-alcohol dehydrogenase-like predicted oxidoreductase|nr:aldo/keto reductase [Gemmatimonadaceae bacterium]